MQHRHLRKRPIRKAMLSSQYTTTSRMSRKHICKNEERCSIIADQPPPPPPLEMPKSNFNETIAKLLQRTQIEEPITSFSSITNNKTEDTDCDMSRVQWTPDDSMPVKAVKIETHLESALGIPRVAPLYHHNAPVHLDVGGITFTTTLATLTKHPESTLAGLFNGRIPVVLDYLKQNYFLDRDGDMFRHVLNYLRHERLLLPDNFQEFDLLEQEAVYYGLHEMVTMINLHRNTRKCTTTPNNLDT
ncbi:BTB/POZ domain-containing protein kctd15 [Trichinella pseudospiralis]|uniref:BTB/POZ domain-containing protein kctd15 n=2 Tax=Trichinella pseudospiralis TaxID=6337 RepID=A0A0V0Y4F5_TRIPS|nr:BTB/POZ domain-containing protein kctd15 [Trichinella pseudospiralis]KRY68190.1 BTB/POZ domain-containing protein kctd15 [Trichinella pseudospiralis]KRY85925.1 BTB/POZ domain-containing protein kctd15 [Trichinella pseudospiralis]KRZ25785.1 BTB/POZ domain-containing protein kctd15 [Trichinella pseudospiralis]KRZ31704.1 BTB/POZ domain-containing protein kctd15 [Trichinella pseudospiralis]